ncbi:uncharacterized protein EV420DRAFT_1561588 [Desarmillaria tabescens]|uniref:Uncharacterized protein n=1 Tax=Armillaria tabescens TaxID=1929756 RepID=A0AA39K2V3_ARMTA|nr:uncharacterized protein EV420DRAFT_1561588 [Desarmillaria tabescens]KAK0451228.1 hypothetical protein EV420DRAFT_1561588 [Desarmillaria tabescens]
MNYSYPGPRHPWTDPVGRLEALCILEIQQQIAGHYMEAREYWNENRKKCGDVAEFPEGPAYGPNEAQRIVESFYVDIGLLPRQRLRRPPLAKVVEDPVNEGLIVSISTLSSSSSRSSAWRRYFPKTKLPKKIWSQVCRRSVSMSMIRKLSSSSLVSFFIDISRKSRVDPDTAATSSESPNSSDQNVPERPRRGRTLSAPDRMVTIFQPSSEPLRSIDSVLVSPAFVSSASSSISPTNGAPPSRPRRRNTVNDADTVVARARLAEYKPTPARRRELMPPTTIEEVPFLTEEQEAALRDWKETIALWDRRRQAIAKADAELYWYHFLWLIVVLNWSIVSFSVIFLFQLIFRLGRLAFRL